MINENKLEEQSARSTRMAQHYVRKGIVTVHKTYVIYLYQQALT